MSLTRREQQVADLVAEGLGDKQIAARLGISRHTASHHVQAALRKLDAPNRAALAVKARTA